ncbi:MAG: hypothetical protein KGJ02_07845 [Verrucomicrobiota bacterium]|nr:hypothetical protein [Verrucomicrobiota bacterium]
MELHLTVKKNEEKTTSLNVQIPPNFMMGNKDCKQGNLLIEYIPEGEKMRRWNEIISVTRDRLPAVDIHGLLKTLKSLYAGEKFDCEVEKEKGVVVAFFTVDKDAVIPSAFQGGEFEKIPGKKEITMMKIVQGEKSVSIVQYAARYDKKIPSPLKKELKNKMLSFLNSCKIDIQDIPK